MDDVFISINESTSKESENSWGTIDVVLSPLKLDLKSARTQRKKREDKVPRRRASATNSNTLGIKVEKVKPIQPAGLGFERPVEQQYNRAVDAKDRESDAEKTGCQPRENIIDQETQTSNTDKTDCSTSDDDNLASRLPVPIATMERLSIRERINRVAALQSGEKHVPKPGPVPGKLVSPLVTKNKLENGVAQSRGLASKEIGRLNKPTKKQDPNDANNNSKSKVKNETEKTSRAVSNSLLDRNDHKQQQQQQSANVIRTQSPTVKSGNLLTPQHGERTKRATAGDALQKRVTNKPPKPIPTVRSTKIVKTVGTATDDVAVEVICASTPAKTSEITMEVQSIPLTSTPQLSADAGYGTLDATSLPVAIRMKPERIMRDFHITANEVRALKTILKKIDLYDGTVRDTLFPILKGNLPPGGGSSSAGDASIDDESLPDIVLRDAARDSLKEKLYLSRRELDSYIAFCKKMEKQKRQSVSEKEELSTKLQWHERRLSRMENENRGLKIERTELLNQVYELRCPSNVPIHERTGSVSGTAPPVRQTSERVVTVEPPQSSSSLWLEVSKQRLMYEADAFAQERGKLIKERQRLDEEVRKVQIRCVSLLAQLQHGEKTIDTLQREKEGMKEKMAKMSKVLLDDNKKLYDKLVDVEAACREANSSSQSGLASDIEPRLTDVLEQVQVSESIKLQLKDEIQTLEEEVERLGKEQRTLEEEKLAVDSENMALRESLEGLRSVNAETEGRFEELNEKVKEQMSEVGSLTDIGNSHMMEKIRLQAKVEELTVRLSESQKKEFSGDDDRRAFRNFLDMLSLKLEEKLGEDHVTRDTEGSTLQEQADLLGKEIAAHLSPGQRGMPESDYADVKEERDDLREEVTALKYAMSCRVEIANTRQPVVSAPPPEKTCTCSREKEKMLLEMKDMANKSEQLEDEVRRLHDDKQSLLMSFLNLQAASRSRDTSRIEVTNTDDDSGDETAEDDDDDEQDASDREEVDADEDDDGSSVEGVVNGQDVMTEKHEQGSLVISAAADQTDDLSTPRKDAEAPCGNVEELQHQLDSITTTKERLENERVGLLESVCRHEEEADSYQLNVDRLTAEVAVLRKLTEGQVNSACQHCSATGIEVRQYLSIIEELTEDKLRLEKIVADATSEKERTQRDLEHVSEERYYLQCDVDALNAEKEQITHSARDEIEYILQTLENVEQENVTLDEHLKKQRQDKLELLDRLKEAEEDRLGLIKTLKMMGDSRTDEETVDAMMVDGSGGESTAATPDSESGSVQGVSGLIIDLKGRIDAHQKAYAELEKAMTSSATTLNNERVAKEQLLEDKQRLESQVKALQSQLLGNASLDLDKQHQAPLHRSASDGLMRNSPLMMRRRTSPLCDVPEVKSPQDTSPLADKVETRMRRSHSLDQDVGKKNDRLSKAKTLCFQISFNSDAI